jgi:hypothetical protein
MALAGPSPFFLQSSNHEKEDNHDTYEETPIYLSNNRYRVASKRIFSDAESVLIALTKGEVRLRRAEGTKVAHIEDKIFIDGEVYYMFGFILKQSL